MTKGRVAFCCPTWERPTDAFLDALEGSLPLLDAAGWEHHATFEVTNPYISAARASMLGKALDWGADVIVFIDDDVSWEPKDLLTLIETEGDVVAGNYRYKTDDREQFMGKPFLGPTGHPLVREDGCVCMMAVPAGFLKVTSGAIDKFLEHYPHLRMNWEGKGKNVDLFNHGAFNGVWFGEDFAFCRNWLALGGDIWCVPNLNLAHNSRGYWDQDGFHPGKRFPSNYHQFLINYRPEKAAA